MSDSLFLEYNKRTGGSITPPKKVVNCAASLTHLDFQATPAVQPIKPPKQVVKAEMAHVAADHIEFGASTFEKARPQKNNEKASTGADHIEFGKSETEKIPVKKTKVPEHIKHVADDKVAFGERNINTNKCKSGRKLILEVDHIEFGASQTFDAPKSPTPDAIDTLLKETDKNSVPATTPHKAAKLMISAAQKSEMNEIISCSPPRPNKTPKSVRKPVGDQESFVLGDCWSETSKVLSPRPVLVDARSEKAIPVLNTSKTMQSSVFDTTPPSPNNARRAKKETENVCPTNNTTVAHSMTAPKSVTVPSSPVRSAKKTIPDRGTMGSVLSDNAPKNGSVRSAKKTINPGTVFAFSLPEDVRSARPAKPSVEHSSAAGAKVKPLEAPVRTRGPVGGAVHVVFG